MEEVINIEGLIGDLALIMVLGAVSTIVFKLLKQPVVLGYIVAGFLASPHFGYLPTISNEANIEFWAQIGIVVLLFSLGLEFSFKKLMAVGGSAVVTALIIVSGMLSVGYVTGHYMGLSSTNCLFLGGMLSMSSTTIIIKALTDLNLRQQRFASMVFAVLVVEDLFAVVLMVLLSSVAINNSLTGSELMMSVLTLLFFLVIWFTVGVYAIPPIFRYLGRKINDEMLLVISMALCFFMAIFSVKCGFSMALGAFVMGSILAGTTQAESIEKVISPVKDLFGAVFFISVGMMVDPTIIAMHASTIALLSIVVIVGMTFFGTFGMLVMGQSIKVSIQSGLSLTQIGEFSFIIATLGMSLGVLEATIYPIVVAVSVVTTFFTPYFIKLSEPASQWIEKKLPERILTAQQRYSERGGNSNDSRAWAILARNFGWRVLLYSVIIVAIIIVSTHFVQPIAVEWLGWNQGTLLSVAGTLMAMSVFLIALASPSIKRDKVDEIVRESSVIPIVAIQVLRIGLAAAFVFYYLHHYYSGRGVLIGFALMILLIAILFTRGFRQKMNIIEYRFLSNLNERELTRSGRGNNLVSNLHLARINVGYGCPFVGEKLKNSDLRRKYGVNIVSITRGSQLFSAPDGEMRIFPGDRLAIVGTDEQIHRLLPIVESDASSQSNQSDASLKFLAIHIGESSPILGKTSATSQLRTRYGATLVAIERNGEYLVPNGEHKFRQDDTLWIAGEEKKLKELM